jgi:UDP-N-acetylmuramoyl-tripeptide--D-alanyl-D-alanine ligase
MHKLYRIIRKINNRIYILFIFLLAYIWRRLLFKTNFIAITGSIGKTTTKDCIAAIFSAYYPTAKTLDSRNQLTGVPRTILSVRPWHRFAIIEIGTDKRGTVGKLARLVRPDVAIVLTIAKTHTNVFANLEETAFEKVQLLKYLKPDGLAILNAEDERVSEMALKIGNEVKKFGLSEGYDLWADEIYSRWPVPLRLMVHTTSKIQLIKTNLVGEHWVNSIQASLLTALFYNIKLEDAALALEQVKPFIARMQPVQISCGATIIRDEFNGSLDSLAAAIKVLRDSDVERRILVLGDIHSPEHSRSRAKKLGEMTSDAADLVIFIGECAHRSVKAAIACGMKPECVKNFINLHEAALYLKSIIRIGDLVLLKGRSSDHLSRIYFALLGTIGCWKQKCRKMLLCDLCNELKPGFDMKVLVPAELRK